MEKVKVDKNLKTQKEDEYIPIVRNCVAKRQAQRVCMMILLEKTYDDDLQSLQPSMSFGVL